MKKIVYILVAAAMAVVACQKQAVEPMYSIEETDHGTYIFTIKAVNDAADPAVKSDYDGSGNFSWSAGDAISVLFHNGDDNKFFTLTTTGTGKSATFSGEITSGYEIGASDGNVSDKKVWALFPASANHTYTAGSNPSFYVQPEVDFTATHFSANIPMYALAADPESGLTFANLASTYKFIVKNLDSSVKKVKLLVSNQTTTAISGLWPISRGTDTYINFDYADPGSANNCITLTTNKNGNEAVFYVSCRYWGQFQPIITIYDAETNFILKRVSASAAKKPTSLTKVQPITISAPGEGSPLPSEFGIDWGSVDMYPADDLKSSFPGDGGRIIEWKATSDATNIYFYYVVLASVAQSRGQWESYINTGYDLDNDNATGGNLSYGLGNGFEAYSIIYPFTNGAGSAVTFKSGVRSDNKTRVYESDAFVDSSAGVVPTYGSLAGDYAYVEASVPREKIGSPAASSTIRLRISLGSTASAAQTITLQ